MPEVRQIVARVEIRGKASQVALYPQAASSNRFEMCAARDDGDVGPGSNKRSSEESSDRAGSDDRYPDSRRSRGRAGDWEIEATGRFELPNGAFAEPCLTTWLRRRHWSG